WTMDGSWNLTTSNYNSPSNSMTESPNGNYSNNLDISSTLYGFSLTGATDASFSFYTKYALETSYDYTYLQITTNGINWTTIDTYNDFQNSWIIKEYSLSNYLGEPFVQIRFKFESDTYVTEDGMYIDDFEINAEGIVGCEEHPAESMVKCAPNPAASSTIFTFTNEKSGKVNIRIFDIKGRTIKEIDRIVSTGEQQISVDLEGIKPGLYFAKVSSGNAGDLIKLMITK
ncbi:MAG: immune inhibitor A, partial [Bacteroidales bacterium]|nr:immune inhibitor A [Bacteroidales bacterium]